MSILKAIFNPETVKFAVGSFIGVKVLPKIWNKVFTDAKWQV